MGGDPGLGKGLGGLWKDWKAGWAGCQMIHTCRENQSPAIAQQYTWEEIGKRAAKIKTFRQGRQLRLSQSTTKSSNVSKILSDFVNWPASPFSAPKKKTVCSQPEAFWSSGASLKMGIEPVEPMKLMWFSETVFCCFSLLWNKSWEQKDQRTLKLVTLATVLAVSNADQRRGNIVLKRLESYYHLCKGHPNLIVQNFMGGFSKQ